MDEQQGRGEGPAEPSATAASTAPPAAAPSWPLTAALTHLRVPVCVSVLDGPVIYANPPLCQVAPRLVLGTTTLPESLGARGDDAARWSHELRWFGRASVALPTPVTASTNGHVAHAWSIQLPGPANLVLTVAELTTPTSNNGDGHGVRHNAHPPVVVAPFAAAIVYDPATDRIVAANPEAGRLFARPHEQLLEHSPADFSAPRQSDGSSPNDLRTRYQACARAGDDQAFEWVHRGEHAEIVCAVQLHPFDERSGSQLSRRLVRASIREAGPRREVETNLRQGLKSDAIGRLAGGVAHDFNNLLTAISGNVMFLLDALPIDSPLRMEATEIRDAAERATELGRQLLAFSRRQVLHRAPLDVRDAVATALTALRRILDPACLLVVDPANDLPAVEIDAGQLQQLILNVVVNAHDALPRGGALFVSTRRVDVDDATAAAHPGAKAGAYVEIQVADTGRGMSAEVLGRVFEPFFTTSAGVDAVGLGLTTVKGIVGQLRGFVDIASYEGDGTVVHVLLPGVEAQVVAPATKETRASTANSQGNETILVVEDNDAVRATVERILRAFGYRPIVARHGAEALRIAGSTADPIHLVLTDIVMPEMSGSVLAERLSSERPELPILFMSGYAEEAVERHGMLAPNSGFIRKPFTPAELTNHIRTLLDRE